MDKHSHIHQKFSLVYIHNREHGSPATLQCHGRGDTAGRHAQLEAIRRGVWHTDRACTSDKGQEASPNQHRTPILVWCAASPWHHPGITLASPWHPPESGLLALAGL